MNRRWLIIDREEKQVDDWWEDDELATGLHLMLTANGHLLSITLESGEFTVRTRYRYFQRAFSLQCHMLRSKDRWAYIQAGTRTLWFWKR